MHGLMCEEQDERILVYRLDEVDSVPREDIRHVAGLAQVLTVDIHLGVEVHALPDEGYPPIEPRPG